MSDESGEAGERDEADDTDGPDDTDEADETTESSYRADTDWPVLALMRDHGRPYLHLAVAGLLIRLVWIVPGQASTAILGYAYDTLFSNERTFAPPLVPQAWIQEPIDQLWLVAGAMLGLTVLGKIFQVLRTLSWGAFAFNLQHDVRTGTYDTVQRLEMGFFDDHQTGEVMSILNNDVNEMEAFFTETIDDAMTAASFLLGVGFFMALLNWQFTLVALAVVPVIVAANYWFSGRIGAAYGAIRETTGKLNAQLQNSVSGISVVKAYTAEPFEYDRVEAASERVVDAGLELVDIRARHYPSMRALTGVGVVLTFGVGAYWVVDGPPGPFTLTLTAGTLLTFLLYTQRISWPMIEVAGVIDSYQSATASADRILGVQRAAESVTERPDATELDAVDGGVSYDDVTFAYPESDQSESDERESPPVLTDVSFDVDPGETVGIVGPTGAGKSTLLKLLMRFYDVDEGSVSVDGHDVRDLTVDSVRDAVGYISQDPFLFSGTVRANVTYGTPQTDEAAVWTALERAEADAFVADLPDGLDTTIGERGVKLSGGQRQRLCLARTMLHDPGILVLDEATSHVDNETEALIQRSIASLVAERTTIVVAHRLSTVRDADRIVVMDDGEVAEVGTHDELLDADGLYASLWHVQVGDVQSLPAEFVDRVERRADAITTD
ncbi:ATP-binding cassette, subfamily B [Halomicrobium zhouii]|uniref:ATP-binding cassette, subfamily B n=1 Tax=Halomicrobium zhouii TaxID=767519 RepID=A0A1I6KZV3_9EURY|nr:ABC transporter ATP-binding protein [Halomicrobium zhouii]SFR96460.1 ATP-binding cassette, subfamily B [Halomicrobium zhouii]